MNVMAPIRTDHRGGGVYTLVAPYDDWNATDKWAEADRQAVCYLSLYAPTPLLFTVYSFTVVPIAVYNDQRRQFIGQSPTNT